VLKNVIIYLIEVRNLWVKECKNTDYPYIIIENKTYVKESPEDLLLLNLYCYPECPYNSNYISKEDNNNSKLI
jgi:hypothetical protein